MTMSLTSNASQATQIEQARAVAEALGAIEAAKRWPRDVEAAVRNFIASCSRMQFAERAFWRFARKEEQLTGPSIDFAEEAARCWGNILSGTAELVRRAGESDMLAYATDLETNYTRRAIFVSPHVGYADTPKRQDDGTWRTGRTLRSMRDIRENNQSAGSRVEREQILAVIPSWFVEMGIATCYKTLAGNTEEPIEDRRRKCLALFENELSVSRELLVAKIGVDYDRWLPADLATLRVIYQSIKRGESTIDAEFADVKPRSEPKPTVTGEDLAGGETAEQPEPSEDKASRTDINAIFARMGELGIAGRSTADRARRLRVLELITGETLGSMNDLSPAGARHVREALRELTAEDIVRMLAEDDTERARDAADGEQGAQS
jgi:hypothetical protein